MFNHFFPFFELNQIDPFTDWLGAFIVNNGIFAPMLALLLEEAGVPLPIPGDIDIAYAGYLVSKGAISYALAFALLLLSVVIGASILYYLSAVYGQAIVLKFGKYLHLNEKKLLTVEGKFRKYGVWVIIFGRHIPGFRIPITIFSGMSEVRYRTFILSTFVSVVFWILFYLSLGQRLGPRILKLLHGHHGYFILLIIPLIILTGFILYLRFMPKRK